MPLTLDLDAGPPPPFCRPFASRCVYKRYDDQVHGFCAARGDWSQPEVAAAAGEAIGILADFFNKNL
jgi:hypothetical protein